MSPRSQDAVDVASMLERVRAEEGISADEGTGDVKVWRIEDLKKADVPKGTDLHAIASKPAARQCPHLQ